MSNTSLPQQSTAHEVVEYLRDNFMDSLKIIRLTWARPAWPGPGQGPQDVLPGERPLCFPGSLPTRAKRRTALALLQGLVQTRERRGIGLAVKAMTPELEEAFAREALLYQENVTLQPPSNQVASTPEPRPGQLSTTSGPGNSQESTGPSTRARSLYIIKPLKDKEKNRSGPVRFFGEETRDGEKRPGAGPGLKGGLGEGKDFEIQDVNELQGAVHKVLAGAWPSISLSQVSAKVVDLLREGVSGENILLLARHLSTTTPSDNVQQPLQVLGFRATDPARSASFLVKASAWAESQKSAQAEACKAKVAEEDHQRQAQAIQGQAPTLTSFGRSILNRLMSQAAGGAR